MNVKIEDSPERRLVHVSGEIDLDSSPELQAALTKAQKNAQTVKVELRDVTYIDSSGVAVLIQALKRAGKLGASFALVEPSARVLAVLELAQLQRLFTIEPAERA